MTGTLTFGALDLTDPNGNYSIEALGTDSGTTFGNPEAIVTQLRSLLQYGSLVFQEGVQNRSPVIAVAVRGADMAETAQAEAALVAELFKPNEMIYTPDGWASGTVYDILFSDLEATPDDLLVALRAEVVYMIRLTAGPYVHSESVTVTPALAASGTTTTNVNNGSGTTNWTGKVNGAATSPSSVGGAVSVTSGVLSGLVTESLTYTAAIDTSATKYLVVDWKVAAGPPVQSFSATADGVALTQMASAPSPTAGYTRTTFYVEAAAVAAVTFTVIAGASGKGRAFVHVLSIDNLDRSDVRPVVGTARQQVRTIEVGGSMPTTGSLSVEHETSSLGDVLIYTCPDDNPTYVPACRNYWVTGMPVVADANAVSGFYSPNGDATFDVPVAALDTGEHLVMVRALRTTAATVGLDWTYTPRMGGVDLTAVTFKETSLALATTYGLHRLGVVHLPLWDAAPGPTSVVRFTTLGDTSTRLDELYLFNLTTGRLSQFSLGTAAPSAGGASNRLWIDSPSLANNGLGRLLRGYAGDQSDAFSAYPSAVAPDIHEFVPPQVKVFTVATNPSTAVDVAFEHRKAWLHHAAD